MNESKELFRAGEKDYGQQYKDHLFSQYRLYIESAEKISDRRQNANNYFITMNTVLIAFLGVLFQAKMLESIPWVKSLVSLVGGYYMCGVLVSIAFL